jgi:Ca2+-binding RTX toxin-like protein
MTRVLAIGTAAVCLAFPLRAISGRVDPTWGVAPRCNPMVRSARIAASLMLGAGILVPGIADAAPLCRFDEVTGHVHVDLPTQSLNSAAIVLARDGDAIVVDGHPCGTATVFDADTISIRGEEQPPAIGHRFEVDLSGGSFSPGRTDEGDGSSEIEIRIDTGPSAGDDVTIRGGAEADVFELRGTALNLDAAPDDRPDVRFVHLNDLVGEEETTVVDSLHLLPGDGDDRLDVRGPPSGHQYADFRAGPGDDVALSTFYGVFGGPGDDAMRNEGLAALVGGPGDDRLVAHTIAKTVFMYGGGGNDVLIGGTAFNSLNGAAGDDVLRGQPGKDYLTGGSGSDRLLGHAGRDTLHGGRGGDRLYGGRGRDRCDRDPRDLAVRSCGA